MAITDVPSAPRDSAESRTLLQARLGLFGKAGAAITGFFGLIDLVIVLTLNLPGGPAITTAQFLGLVISLALIALMRGPPLRVRTLLLVDFLFAWIQCAVYVVAYLHAPLYTRPELVQLLCVSDILALRAFMVPSTPQRTASVGSVPIAAVIAATFVFYTGAKVHPDAPGRGAYVLIASLLGFGTLLITTLTSATIYGLRARIREAMQLGQYTLLRKIGEGAMGVVYEAGHAMLRRRTAIKLLRPERAGEHNLVRFEREVQLTSTLTHPNTVAIYDYGRASDGTLYYAMEYLDGVDLQTLVEIDGAQAPGRVVHVLTQVAGALQEAHEAGLIHRDVKPANILLCDRPGASDVAKVVDFGLVKSVAADGDPMASTTGTIIGTPLYMAPEAIMDPSRVDARSDLYALGAVGYFLLTGEPPFSGTSVVEVCGHHLHSVPPEPSQRATHAISPALDAIVLSCLAKTPGERPGSADELALRLAECPEARAWDRETARAWWKRNAARLAERPSNPPRAASPFTETIAVDLADRRAAQPNTT